MRAFGSFLVAGLFCLALTGAGAGGPPRVPEPRAVARCQGCWLPEPRESWQLQLQGAVDLSVRASVYEVDGADASAGLVSRLHRGGRHAICYFNAGAWESWRKDSSAFPPSLLGAPLLGWPGERWLDIRSLKQLAPVMRARLEQCRAKGFDAVDPDNVDAYANDTGFALTYSDQLRYNRWLAGAAHRLGLSVALKNDLDQVGDLAGDFDFAVTEQCFEYRECERLQPFVRAGKAVFEVEYSLPTAAFCPQARKLGFSSVRKRLALGVYRQSC